MNGSSDVKMAENPTKSDEKGDVVARAPDNHSAEVVPPKKRKTRRGKSKRKAPYQKFNKPPVKRIVKPEAPRNDNNFLIEDHGGLEDLDSRLKNLDEISTCTVARTRDSSFSVESENDEFYSSPDDEAEFFMEDFNEQYQNFQSERLQAMTKQELIDETLQVSQKNRELEDAVMRLQEQLSMCQSEKEQLRAEIDQLRAKEEHQGSSEDSETDSSDSCSSSSGSSRGSSRSRSPLENNFDYSRTNGHSPKNVDVV